MISQPHCPFSFCSRFLLLTFTPVLTPFLQVGMRETARMWITVKTYHANSPPLFAWEVVSLTSFETETNQPFVKNRNEGCLSLKASCKFLKSFAACHLQKSHFKIFDVSLKYSGSHFGAAAYFKMTGLKDPVFFSFVPFELPQGDPTTINIFLLLLLLLLPSRVTLGSRLAVPFNDLI